MAKENRVAVPSFGNVDKKFVARLPRCSFNRQFLFFCETANLYRFHRNVDIVLVSNFFDEARIGIARTSAEPVIQMTDDQIFVAGLDQPMEERNRIAAA